MLTDEEKVCGKVGERETGKPVAEDVEIRVEMLKSWKAEGVQKYGKAWEVERKKKRRKERNEKEERPFLYISAGRLGKCAPSKTF